MSPSKKDHATKPSIGAVLVIAAVAIAAVISQGLARALAVVEVLRSFDGGVDGGGFLAGVIQASDGYLYGMGTDGGTFGHGTVFRLSPTTGVVTTLHSFTLVEAAGSGGGLGGLTQATDGNLYGLEAAGEIFKITPTGTFVPLHSMTFGEGVGPFEGLIQAADGDFYGAMSGGGTFDLGTVVMVTPTGTVTPLHSFAGPDGARAVGALVQATDGNLYGTTYLGGSFGDTANLGGTIFRVTPSGVFVTLHSFAGTDGQNPTAALAQGADGSLYGTTSNGGAFGLGTVFKVTLDGSFTLLHSFAGVPDGAHPGAASFNLGGSLILAAANGRLYGTTARGGASGCGTIFEIATDGAVNVVYSFSCASDGQSPIAGLTQATDGEFYGTTLSGGSTSDGVVFRIDLGIPNCTFSLSPTGQGFPTAGGLGSFTVSTAAACGWSAIRGASWITILPSASKGTGKVSFAIAANSGPARTGTIPVGGQHYNIDQQGRACTFSIGPTVGAFDGTGGSARVVVTALTGCPWTATSNVGWMSIDSGASANGTGAVVITAAADPDGPRSGTVSIAGQTFSATQGAASACGALDVTAQMGVSKGGFQVVPPAGSNLYTQVVTVRNSSAAVIHGPVYLVLLGEPTYNPLGSNYDTSLVFPPAVTTCFSTQGDYLQPVWPGDIQPGQQIPGTLTWIRSVFAPTPSYSYRVLSGAPSR